MTKLKVTPEDNPTSQSLKAGGDKNLANLKTLKGAAFDKAYVDNEVAYHQQVLDAVDKTLIPSASNAELKALLVKARPMFVDHIDQAPETAGLGEQGDLIAHRWDTASRVATVSPSLPPCRACVRAWPRPGGCSSWAAAAVSWPHASSTMCRPFGCACPSAASS